MIDFNFKIFFFLISIFLNHLKKISLKKAQQNISLKNFIFSLNLKLNLVENTLQKLHLSQQEIEEERKTHFFFEIYKSYSFGWDIKSSNLE